VNTVQEIKQALEQLSADDRGVIADWLQIVTDIPYAQYRVEDPRPAHALAHSPFMTLEEYFEFEEQSQFRHEYVNGTVYAMTGPSVDHARITRELLVAFKNHLHGKPCEPFATDLKLLIHSATENISYYPDLVVACNRDEWGKNYVCNPKLVVEILSPSTRSIDLREKSMTYRRVASIEEYVVLEQDEHKLTAHRRSDDWKPRVYAGPQAIAEFQSIALSAPLKEIYAGTLQEQ
jgi:Uma2 family endonuclease